MRKRGKCVKSEGKRGELVGVVGRSCGEGWGEVVMVRRLVLVPVGLVLFMVFLPTSPVLAECFAMGEFGLQGGSVDVSAVNKDGSVDVVAGSHPYALRTSFLLNESVELPETLPPRKFLPAGRGPRDVRVELPPGFVGNPTAVPRCAYSEFTARKRCPNDTVIGEATTIVAVDTGYDSPVTGKYVDQFQYYSDPVYNVEPPGGVAAEFGFFPEEVAPVLINASVRTGGDYGITATSRVPQAVVVQGAKVTIWGVPAEASHNRARGECLAQNETDREEAEEGHPRNEEESVREKQEEEGVPPEDLAPAECPVDVPVEPFLTNPTSCGVGRTATLGVDSWEEPGVFDSVGAALPELSGCEKLDFSPTISVSPDGGAGSTPTGLNVDVHVPQESTINPVGLGEADMRDTTVALPAGVQISPSAADGLQACPLLHGREPGKEEREREGRETGIDLESGAPADCPDASKVAKVRIKTPLLEHELEGAVYLAAPQNFAGALENPFGSLIALYLVAEEPAAGVLVKLAGRVEPNLATGQLTTTFENIPQLPAEDVKLEFFGTDRAPLATPGLCGTYTTTSVFTPWSAAEPPAPVKSLCRLRASGFPRGLVGARNAARRCRSGRL